MNNLDYAKLQNGLEKEKNFVSDILNNLEHLEYWSEYISCKSSQKCCRRIINKIRKILVQTTHKN